MDLSEALEYGLDAAERDDEYFDGHEGPIAAGVLALAVERVREVHRPEDVTLYGGRVVQMCAECNTGDPYCTVSSDWPCPTIAALDGP